MLEHERSSSPTRSYIIRSPTAYSEPKAFGIFSGLVVLFTPSRERRSLALGTVRTTFRCILVEVFGFFTW